MLALAFSAFVVASSLVPSPASAPTTPGAHERARSLASARASDGTRAPDGAVGFGVGRTRRELEKLMRSPSDAEHAMLEDLRALALDVEVELARLDRRYVELGYDRLLARGVAAGASTPLGAAERVEAVGRRFRSVAETPEPTLQRGGSDAQLLARMLADVRFRARDRVASDVARELADLRGALALLDAQTDGWVDLGEDEAATIAERADLAAARLRAVRLDLQALRDAPGSIGANAPWQADHERLLRYASEATHMAIERELLPVLERLDRAESAMSAPLFTTALAAKAARAIETRRIARADAAEYLPEARAYDPDAPTGGAPAPRSLKGLTKSERRQRAARLAAMAAAADPLDEHAVWLAATASDAASGRTESRRWFDRYLALHGIRAHDDRTYRGRSLTAEERRALDAVQTADPIVH